MDRSKQNYKVLILLTVILCLTQTTSLAMFNLNKMRQALYTSIAYVPVLAATGYTAYNPSQLSLIAVPGSFFVTALIKETQEHYIFKKWIDALKPSSTTVDTQTEEEDDDGEQNKTSNNFNMNTEDSQSCYWQSPDFQVSDWCCIGLSGIFLGIAAKRANLFSHLVTKFFETSTK
jgi:hypothetical protein